MERDIANPILGSKIVISTHTLTWSVTPLKSTLVLIILHFNSHAHVERDTGDELLAICDRISTHTLTWSVTIANPILGSKIVISTHTLTWSVTSCHVATD